MRQNTKITRLRSLILALIILISSISVPQNSYAAPLRAPKDVTALLKDKKITVFQNGVEITNDGQVYDLQNKPITINVSFGAPNLNDENVGNNYVIKGDTAKIEIGEGIDLLSSPPIPIECIDTVKNKKIGTGVFAKESGKLVLNFTFDGADEVFENLPGKEKYRNIKVELGADFKIDSNGVITKPDGTKIIRVFGKEYTVNDNPSGEKDFTLTKTGKLNRKDMTIKWEVKIIPDQKTNLKGYEFVDDISSIGGYKVGSFKINGTPVSPDPSANTKVLKYKFESDTNAPVTITFETKITEEEFLNKNTKKNKAKLLKENKEIQNAEAEVSWDKWASKSGEYKTDGSRKYIKWTLTFNEAEQDIGEVVLEDKLRTDTTGVTIQKYTINSSVIRKTSESGPVVNIVDKTQNPSATVGTGDAKLEYTQSPNTPTDDTMTLTYTIPNVNTKIILTYETDIIDPGNQLDKAHLKYINYVPIKVNNKQFYVYGEVVVKPPIGSSATIEKTLSNSMSNEHSYVPSEIEWKISVERNRIGTPLGVGDEKKGLVAYDMMFFDPVKFKKDNYNDASLKNKLTLELSTNPSVNALQRSNMELFKIVKSPNDFRHHRYTENSIVMDPGLSYNIYKIKYNGDYVGDLLEVYDFEKAKNNSANVSKTRIGFTFKSYITDLGLIHNNNEYRNSYNTTQLVKNDMIISSDGHWPRYVSRMLKKQVLSNEDAKQLEQNKTADDANRGIDDDNKDTAFNYSTKSAIYRISVNANAVKDAINPANPKDIIVEDELPRDWELVNFDGLNRPYLVFEGEPKIPNDTVAGWQTKDARVIAKGNEIGNNIDPPTITNQDTSPPTQNNPKITFKLKMDGKPYVILLKAKPKDDKIKSDFKSNKNVEYINQAMLKIDDTSTTSKQSLIIKANVLSKDYDKSKVNDGYLTWTVDYKPYDVIEKDPAVQELYLEDILGSGMEIRTVNGELVLGDPNFIMEEVELGQDGKYKTGTLVDNISDYVSYDKTNRTIKMKIPNKDKAYRFKYITDLTGSGGQSVENKVKLIGATVSPEAEAPQKYVISSQHGQGSMEVAPRLEIKKVGKDGTTPLQNVKFRLYSLEANGNFKLDSNGDKIFTEKTSDSNGIVKFENLIAGKYKFEEVETNPDYILDRTMHEMEVTKLDNNLGYQIKVDGDTFGALNIYEKTIKNVKKPDIEILKVKEDNTTPLAGAEFKLTLQDGTFLNKESDSNGIAKFTNVPVGEHKIKEVEPPNGYKLDDKVYTIRVVDTGNDYGKVYWEDNELPFPYQIKIKNDKILVQPPTTTSKTMLEVSKLVRGDNINIDREFTFELKLKNSDDIDVDTNGYIYEKLKSDGSKENLTLSSEGIFKLKHDEKIVLKDIPGKTKYKLTEKDYGEDYKPEVDVYNGTITTESQVSVQFINNMTTYGQLRLEKQVTGSAGDKNKKFEFVVNIDSDKEYDYVIKNKNNEELATSKIRNGGKIYLADGEYAIISGIKVSTNYEITEKSYSSDGYTTTVVGKNVGTIETKDEIVIKFINNRDGGSGGDNPPPTTPKEDPKTPPTTPKEDPKTTPKEDPKTPPTTPKEDPKTTPKEDPKTPPTTPDSPPETPDTPPAPSVPSYPRNNPPDPNDPNSPETIVVVDENGVPLGTYTKRTNPDGTVEYIDEDGVPLGGVLVKTGNEFPENALIITSMVSLLGLVILRRYRRKDK